jgi:hypothetical protein
MTAWIQRCAAPLRSIYRNLSCSINLARDVRPLQRLITFAISARHLGGRSASPSPPTRLIKTIIIRCLCLRVGRCEQVMSGCGGLREPPPNRNDNNKWASPAESMLAAVRHQHRFSVAERKRPYQTGAPAHGHASRGRPRPGDDAGRQITTRREVEVRYAESGAPAQNKSITVGPAGQPSWANWRPATGIANKLIGGAR